MTWLRRLPPLLPMAGIGAVAMFVPAGYASVLGERVIARHFFYSGLMALVLIAMLSVAVAARHRATDPRSSLLSVIAVMTLLPLMLAVPFAESLPDTGLFNAWWEMVSCLTTTGASLYSADLLPAPLHLWRAIVGWMGGMFMLVAAVAILAPLRVGGFELFLSQGAEYDAFDRLPGMAVRRPGRPLGDLSSGQIGRGPTGEPDAAERLIRAIRIVVPVYAGLTLVLWTVLMMLGDPSLVALCRAMGTLSTSGISPVIGTAHQGAGTAGEMMVFLFLLPALSRRFWPGGGELRATEHLRDDPELRIAAGAVTLVAAVLFLRHFVGAIEIAAEGDAAAPRAALSGVEGAFSAAWGGLYNALSFLTTTGWNSAHWEGARTWSGLTAPGLILAGLAMFGGGVATTAGGVKLLRVHALARHGQRELERTIHPASVGGGGRMARQLREQGAYLAFIFFMLFATSIAVVVTLISVHQIEFETATILSIAALTNTGPLAGAIPLIPVFEASAGVASAPWEGWSGLAPMTKLVLAGAMIVGRIELLAVLVVFTPGFWRR